MAAVVSLFTCVLVLIAVPIFNSAKAAGEISLIRGREEHLAISMAMYVDDNDRYPPADRWMDSLEPYAKVPDSFCDPDAGCKTSQDPVLGFGFAKELSAQPPLPEHPDRAVIFELSGGRRNASLPASQIPKRIGQRPIIWINQNGDSISREPVPTPSVTATSQNPSSH